MDAAILIGNGLNRCYTGAVPWDSLLQDIAYDYGVVFHNANPFPLEFESIVNQILSKDKNPSDSIYKELKQKIARSVNEQRPGIGSMQELFTDRLPTVSSQVKCTLFRQQMHTFSAPVF